MSASAMPAEKRSGVRWIPILVLVVGATLINYMDRSVLSVAVPFMSRDLDLDPVQTGWLLSAFGWTYAAAQIPGGIFLDRFGTRLTYFLSLLTWSIVTVAIGAARGIVWLFGCRLSLGIFEAPCFPANSRVLATWFPQNERARANGIYAVGQYAGLGLLSAPLFWITATFGWRVLFVIVGGIGVLFSFVWYHFYRDPQHAKGVNQAELDHIEAGGGLAPKGERTPFAWKNIAYLLRHRQVVGASLGQFAGNSSLAFFITWFPSYLASERNMEWITAGFLASFPFIAAAIGVLLGGLFSDLLLKATGSANFARKVPVVGGLLLVSTIVAANYVPANDNVTVIAILSIAFFGQGLTNLGWTVISDVAPKKLVGLTGGIFNFITNVASITTPLVVGYVYDATHSFYVPLAYIGVVALLGVFSYVVILGDIKRLPDPS